MCFGLTSRTFFSDAAPVKTQIGRESRTLAAAKSAVGVGGSSSSSSSSSMIATRLGDLRCARSVIGSTQRRDTADMAAL